jgi:hypothetical protein
MAGRGRTVVQTAQISLFLAPISEHPGLESAGGYQKFAVPFIIRDEPSLQIVKVLDPMINMSEYQEFECSDEVGRWVDQWWMQRALFLND